MEPESKIENPCNELYKHLHSLIQRLCEGLSPIQLSNYDIRVPAAQKVDIGIEKYLKELRELNQLAPHLKIAPFKLDEASQASMKVIIKCIKDLIKKISDDIKVKICKLLEVDNNGVGEFFITRERPLIEYTSSDIAFINIIIYLNSMKEIVNRDDYNVSINKFIRQYASPKVNQQYTNLNQLIYDCACIFSYREILNSLYVIVPRIHKQYGSVYECTAAIFGYNNRISKPIQLLLNRVYEDARNVCALHGQGHIEDEIYKPYMEYYGFTSELTNAYVDLPRAFAQLDKTIRIITAFNEVHLLTTFWHLMCLALITKLEHVTHSKEFKLYLTSQGYDGLVINNKLDGKLFYKALQQLVDKVVHVTLHDNIARFRTLLAKLSSTSDFYVNYCDRDSPYSAWIVVDLINNYMLAKENDI